MSDETAFAAMLGLFIGALFGWVCRGAHERELRRREAAKGEQ